MHIEVITTVVEEDDDIDEGAKEAKEVAPDIRVPPIRHVWHPLAIAQTVAGHVAASKIEHFLPAHIQVCTPSMLLYHLSLITMYVCSCCSYWMLL